MKAPNFCRRLAIRDKLQLMVLLSSCATLLAASGILLAFEEITVRSDMRNDLSILAEMFGSNSTAALSFNDRQSAGELFSGLRAKRHIVSGTLFSADGTVFAVYRRDTVPTTPRPNCGRMAAGLRMAGWCCSSRSF